MLAATLTTLIGGATATAATWSTPEPVPGIGRVSGLDVEGPGVLTVASRDPIGGMSLVRRDATSGWSGPVPVSAVCPVPRTISDARLCFGQPADQGGSGARTFAASNTAAILGPTGTNGASLSVLTKADPDAPWLASEIASRWIGRPAVAIADDGTAVVVWMQTRRKPTKFVRSIENRSVLMVSIRRGHTGVWSQPKQLTTLTTATGRLLVQPGNPTQQQITSELEFVDNHDVDIAPNGVIAVFIRHTVRLSLYDPKARRLSNRVQCAAIAWLQDPTTRRWTRRFVSPAISTQRQCEPGQLVATAVRSAASGEIVFAWTSGRKRVVRTRSTRMDGRFILGAPLVAGGIKGPAAVLGRALDGTLRLSGISAQTPSTWATVALGGAPRRWETAADRPPLQHPGLGGKVSVIASVDETASAPATLLMVGLTNNLVAQLIP